MPNYILLRHGQTDWNIQRRYQGQEDIPLNATGREQAQNARDALKEIHFDFVYCSDLSRAKETAEIVLQGRDFPVQYDVRLRERGFGVNEGGYFDRDKMDPEILKEMDANPLTFRFPQGESFLDVEKRAKEFADEMEAKHHDQTLLIVAHGALLSILCCVLHGLSPAERARFYFENAEPHFFDLRHPQM